MVLADQLKSLDWQDRKAEYIHHVLRNIISEIVAKIRVLIDDDDE